MRTSRIGFNRPPLGVSPLLYPMVVDNLTKSSTDSEHALLSPTDLRRMLSRVVKAASTESLAKSDEASPSPTTTLDSLSVLGSMTPSPMTIPTNIDDKVAAAGPSILRNPSTLLRDVDRDVKTVRFNDEATTTKSFVPFWTEYREDVLAQLYWTGLEMDGMEADCDKEIQSFLKGKGMTNEAALLKRLTEQVRPELLAQLETKPEPLTREEIQLAERIHTEALYGMKIKGVHPID